MAGDVLVFEHLHQIAVNRDGVDSLLLVQVAGGLDAMIVAPSCNLPHEVVREKLSPKPEKRIARRGCFQTDVVPQGWIVFQWRIAVLLREVCVEGWSPGTPIQPVQGRLVKERHLDFFSEILLEVSV